MSAYDTYLIWVEQFFSYEYWDYELALLLLSGIIPDNNTSIDWKSFGPINTGEHKHSVKIIEARLFDHFTKPLGMERRQFLEKILETEGEWECNDQEVQEAKELIAKSEKPIQRDKTTLEAMKKYGIPERHVSLEMKLAQQAVAARHIHVAGEEFRQAEERLSEYLQVEAVLNKNYALWRSENYKENRHPPSEYIKWARAKKLNIPWAGFRERIVASSCRVQVPKVSKDQRDLNEKELKTTLSSTFQRLDTQEKRALDLLKIKKSDATQEVIYLLHEVQAEYSNLLLMDEFSIEQAVRLMASSTEISQYQVITKEPDPGKVFSEIDNLLSSYFERVRATLPAIGSAVLDGTLECQIRKISITHSEGDKLEVLDNNNSKVTKSAMRKWLLTKPGFFSSGFFPEIKINSLHEWEPIRQGMLSELEMSGQGHDQPASQGIDKPNSLVKAPGYRTGDKELCAAFGVSSNSITTVRKRVKAAGVEFEYDPKTKAKRLKLNDINEILTEEDKKKTKK